jgi:hypothetical protein
MRSHERLWYYGSTFCLSFLHQSNSSRRNPNCELIGLSGMGFVSSSFCKSLGESVKIWNFGGQPSYFAKLSVHSGGSDVWPLASMARQASSVNLLLMGTVNS